MIKKSSVTKTQKGFSAYGERKQKGSKRNLEFQKQKASFCINDCPHKNKPCGNNSCAEYRQFIKELKEKL